MHRGDGCAEAVKVGGTPSPSEASGPSYPGGSSGASPSCPALLLPSLRLRDPDLDLEGVAWLGLPRTSLRGSKDADRVKRWSPPLRGAAGGLPEGGAPRTSALIRSALFARPPGRRTGAAFCVVCGDRVSVLQPGKEVPTRLYRQ